MAGRKGTFLALLQLLAVTVSADTFLAKRAGTISSNLPVNWTYSGCYLDQPYSHTLSGYATYSNTTAMTQESCITYCHSKGFIHAGVEYMYQCFCGNDDLTKETKVPESDCSMACAGNSSEVCGGGNRLDIFTSNQNSTSPVTNNGTGLWSLYGCFQEGTTGRALTTYMDTSPGGESNMTVANCVNSCQGASYLLAGVEDSGQCFCGNQFSGQSVPAVDGFKGCNQPCQGNSSEICGGPNHLDVYGYNYTIPNPATQTSSTVSSTTTSISSSSSVAPASTTSSVSQGSSITVTSSSASSSVSQGSSITATSSSVSSSSAATAAATPSWYAIGCYTDAVGSRTLQVQQYGNADIMTQELCMSKCAAAGYTLSGTEYYSECYCDTQIRNGGALASDQTSCNTACQGNATETCGGGDRLTIFQYGIKGANAVSSSSSSSVVSTSSAPATSSTGSGTTSHWKYLGCYTDAVGTRTLNNAILGQGSVMTNELCQSTCLKGGYTLSGTEYSGECYCDSALRNGGGPATDGETYCNMACNGNTAEICGGGNRLSLYQYVLSGSSSSSSASTASSSSSISGTISPSIAASSSSSAAAVPTAGWTSLGCYNDSVGVRTLSHAIYGNGNIMTNELCQSSCKSAGYILSGTEYSGECYCDNTIQNYGAPASDGCTMTCNGNVNEFCGGSNRLNLFRYATISASSSSSSATPSSSSSSLLPSTVSGTSSSTAVSSSTSSSSSHSTVSGTSSTSVSSSSSSSSSSHSTVSGTSSTSVSSSSSSSSSHSTVSGTSSTSVSSSSSSSSSSHSTVSGTSSTSISSSSSSSSSSHSSVSGTSSSTSVSSSSSSSPSSSSSSHSTTSGTSSTSISSSSSLTSTSSSASASPTIAIGWTALGCYTDSVGARTLANGIQVLGGGNNMTVENCQVACLAAKYTLSGVEYAGQCYCDTAFRNGGGPAPDGNTYCNMACSGNASEICGGPDRLNVYSYYAGPTPTGSSTSSTAAASSTATPSSAATGLPTGWKYDGCYVDGTIGRIMNNQQPDNQQMTVESCVQTCRGLGYSVAGMEYSVQCFCDNYLRNTATLASTDTQCNMACGGNSAENCGAGGRMSVYNIGNLTVLNPPAVQNSSLPGNWTYQGCLTDNADARTFPYRIVNMIENNTATNCLSLCSTYGYPAGGMEFSSECYCGDFSDIVNAGATFAPESDCNMACSGDPNAICGSGGRISYYAWTGSDLYKWARPTGNDAGAYEFLIGGVVIPLVTQQTIKGKVTFLEKFGTGAPNTTGAYELDLAEINNFTAAWRPMHVKTDIFCSASLTLPDKAGRQINIGGWANDATYGIRLYTPSGSPGVAGTTDWQENVNELKLQNGRWYPTSMIMPNGTILVVGGEEGSNGAPVPTLEMLPASGPVLYCDWLERTDPYNLYPFLFVLPTGGVAVFYYNEARILDEVTLETQKVLPNIPAAVNDFLGGRTYPFEGTAVSLPQHAPYGEALTVLICGGSTPGPEIALDNCVSLQPEIANANWTIERMPSKRVISCMTALPDGTYLILNGGQQGRAGFGLSIDPNRNAVLYDPSKPLNQRMSVMANTTIDRLYHSEAILLQDGRVLVSGSDPEDTRFEQEYRVEVFVPPYLLSGAPRPTFTLTDTDWKYNTAYTLTVTSGNIANMRVSLLGAESSTHGNSMGQRTIFPAVSCSGNTCTVTAPPNANICPPGWFQLFLLDGPTPSISTYVRIGGDPAGLGNWPNYPDFQPLPGV